jgi:UDP-N-acetylglucosamine acyltransferase
LHHRRLPAGPRGGESFCRIGSDNIFREHVTIHRGTKAGTETVVGDRCMFLASAHVAHNCVVGNDVTLVNSSMLGGYVHVGDRAVLSGNVGVHQFARVGELAMVGGLTYIRQDAPPFFMYDESGYCAGINAVGLRRAGFSSEERAELKIAYRRLYRTPGTWTDAVADVAMTVTTNAGKRLVEFLQAPSKRGFLARGLPRGKTLELDEPAIEAPPVLRLHTDLEAA